jgi:UDP-N-acetylmuramate dehydrogenase
MPEILLNHSLRDLNSFHLDVYASRFCECRSALEIQELIDRGILKEEPILILGEGSNILFSGNFEGLILRPYILGREIISEDRDNVWIRAGAGENWDDFVSWTTAWGYGGIENLSLIPGSVGSSPIQNIGAYGTEVENTIEEVSAVDIQSGQKMTFLNEACGFGYRDSIFKKQWKDKCIITSVTFRLSKNPELILGYNAVKEMFDKMEKQDVESLRQVIIQIRRSKLPDPEKTGNAGSFFKNPVITDEKYTDLGREYPGVPSYPAGAGRKKIPAAWLIEKSGWKGKNLGRAGSWEKQPLVLVNLGGASGQDILELAARIEDDVLNRFGIKLEKEVNVV